MTITDLDGKEIKVTDVQFALLQADDYRRYRVSDPSPYQLYLYKYWEDVYQNYYYWTRKRKAINKRC